MLGINSRHCFPTMVKNKTFYVELGDGGRDGGCVVAVWWIEQCMARGVFCPRVFGKCVLLLENSSTTTNVNVEFFHNIK